MAEERSLTRSAGDAPAAHPEDTRLGDPTPLVRGTVDELQRILDSKLVVGEPITFGATTVVPLISMGFAFGAGGGGGRQGRTGDTGQGGGGAGGGGMKPIAVLVVNGDAVELAPIPEPPGGFEKLGSALASALEKLTSRKGEDGD